MPIRFTRSYPHRACAVRWTFRIKSLKYKLEINCAVLYLDMRTNIKLQLTLDLFLHTSIVSVKRNNTRWSPRPDSSFDSSTTSQRATNVRCEETRWGCRTTTHAVRFIDVINKILDKISPIYGAVTEINFQKSTSTPNWIGTCRCSVAISEVSLRVPTLKKVNLKSRMPQITIGLSTFKLETYRRPNNGETRIVIIHRHQKCDLRRLVEVLGGV